jgi:leucyl aminopeptidase
MKNLTYFFLIFLTSCVSFFSLNNGECMNIKDIYESQLKNSYDILNISYQNEAQENLDTCVIVLKKDQDLSELSLPLPKEEIHKIQGFLEFSLEKKGTDGKSDSMLQLPFLTKDKYINIILYVLGTESEKEPSSFEYAGKKIYNSLLNLKAQNVSVFHNIKNMNYELAANLGLGMASNKFRFTLKTEGDELKVVHPKEVRFVTVDAELDRLRTNYRNNIKPLINAINITKTYCDGPANLIYPESMTNYILDDFKKSKLGLEVDVLTEKEMTSLGMGALLGVAQGSVFKPRMLVIKWNGGEKQEAPILFVGKGVTFDSGGLSIKPADSMEEMKYDMSGAGTVAGVMRLLAERKAKVNAVGIIALVENAVSGTAQRPGDVVTSMSGKTIEVLNTDAEGRLILADALTYGQTKLGQKPSVIIDLATLTGACIVALGSNINAAVMSNDEDLASRLLRAGKVSNENLWRLPLGKGYAEKMNSKIADIQNISNAKGFGGGTITAAEFLNKFIEPGMKWAHLDIANSDNYSSNQTNGDLKGSRAFGIKLLNEFVLDFEKNK